ncbi:MAG: patatin-like phospholipase family protein [Desulfovibrio sp.]|nr:patatin-like phospholipase family protein [Desulfovibrio sp.]
MNVGIALGSGSARGWAHIGVLEALAGMGIVPRVVAGTSIGAVVGAAYAAGRLSAVRDWACAFSRTDVASYVNFTGLLQGLISPGRLRQSLAEHVVPEDLAIEDMPRHFACVATEMSLGREQWFTQGSALDAVWASMALPAVLPPVRSKDSWYVDGGLVNPVPVSVCRALGADVVIAVNLNGALLPGLARAGAQARDAREAKAAKAAAGPQEAPMPAEKAGDETPQADSIRNQLGRMARTVKDYAPDWLGWAKGDAEASKPVPPGILETVLASVNIAQDRITRSRMAGDPPDVLVTPRLGHLGLLDFHRAEEAIAEGRRATEAMRPAIEFAVPDAEPWQGAPGQA